jgi:hypothetical protein
MSRIKQFTIVVQNQPGAVAEIAKTLGGAKVNILALSGTAQGTNGTVQLVVEDTAKAKKALDGAKIGYEETAAEQYELPNKPGALAEHLEKLAARGVSLSSIYATAHKGAKTVSVVCAAESEAKAAAAAPGR